VLSTRLLSIVASYSAAPKLATPAIDHAVLSDHFIHRHFHKLAICLGVNIGDMTHCLGYCLSSVTFCWLIWCESSISCHQTLLSCYCTFYKHCLRIVVFWRSYSIQNMIRNSHNRHVGIIDSKQLKQLNVCIRHACRG
jgi:hypothetical protein